MAWKVTDPESGDTTNWYARKNSQWQKLPPQGIIVGRFKLPTPDNLPVSGLIPANFFTGEDDTTFPEEEVQLETSWSLIYTGDNHLWQFVGNAKPEGWVDAGQLGAGSGVWVPSSGEALLPPTYSAAAPQVDADATLGTTGLGWSALHLSDGVNRVQAGVFREEQQYLTIGDGTTRAGLCLRADTDGSGDMMVIRATANDKLEITGATTATAGFSVKWNFDRGNNSFSPGGDGNSSLGTTSRGWGALHLSNGTGRGALTVDNAGDLFWNGVKIN